MFRTPCYLGNAHPCPPLPPQLPGWLPLPGVPSPFTPLAKARHSAFCHAAAGTVTHRKPSLALNMACTCGSPRHGRECPDAELGRQALRGRRQTQRLQEAPGGEPALAALPRAGTLGDTHHQRRAPSARAHRRHHPWQGQRQLKKAPLPLRAGTEVSPRDMAAGEGWHRSQQQHELPRAQPPQRCWDSRGHEGQSPGNRDWKCLCWCTGGMGRYRQVWKSVYSNGRQVTPAKISVTLFWPLQRPSCCNSAREAKNTLLSKNYFSI